MLVVKRYIGTQEWTVSGGDNKTQGPRLVLPQELRSVNDKKSDGHDPYVGHKGEVVSSARPANAQDPIWEWMTVAAGFILHFIGLWALGYPRSITQISFLNLFSLVRAGKRRRRLEHGWVFTGCELDYLAIYIAYCPIGEQFEARDDTGYIAEHSLSWSVNVPSLRNPNVPLQSEKSPQNQSPAVIKDGEQARGSEMTTNYGVAKSFTRLLDRLLREPRVETVPSWRLFASSEQLLRVHKRLGNFGDCSCKASYHASILCQSIEIFMDTFLPGGETSEDEGGGDVEPKELNWYIGVTGPNNVQDKVVVRFDRDASGGHWRSDLDRIEAILSLWTASFENQLMDARHNTEPDRGLDWAQVKRAESYKKHSFR
jgi:hypothetical protein